jgi:uncharacterized protein YecE (DUF72 family)
MNAISDGLIIAVAVTKSSIGVLSPRLLGHAEPGFKLGSSCFNGEMKFHVGTSGYSYKEWKGSFYPADMSPKEMLPYYAQRFGAVEINNTFYRMPTASMLEAWADQVPAGFQFVLKAPQRITHFQRLVNAGKTVSDFLRVAKVLKARLGAVLFQLPPNMKKDLPRLRDFLLSLPPKHRIALEFRHPSWLDDEAFNLLRERQIALCVAEAEDGVAVPLLSTAGWGYVRLRMPNYSSADLKKWIKGMRQQKWDDAFVFFKHEDEAKGPKFAKKFLELMS